MARFYHFLLLRYLNSSMTWFSSDILLPFPNLNDLNSHDIFHPVGKFAQLPFMEWETKICFCVSFFPKGLNYLRLNSRGIHESNNNLFEHIFWFLKIWLSITLYGVWIKNDGITHCMGLVNKSLLADLMMMILNLNKTDGGCSLSHKNKPTEV